MYPNEEVLGDMQEARIDAYEKLTDEYIDGLTGLRPNTIGGWWDSTIEIMDDFKCWVICDEQHEAWKLLLEGKSTQAFIRYAKARALAEVSSFDDEQVGLVLRGEHEYVRHFGR